MVDWVSQEYGTRIELSAVANIRKVGVIATGVTKYHTHVDAGSAFSRYSGDVRPLLGTSHAFRARSLVHCSTIASVVLPAVSTALFAWV